MLLNRGSSAEWNSSDQVAVTYPRRTVRASWNETPCLRTFSASLSGSHV